MSNVFVVNAGSSSLKYELLDPDSGEVAVEGEVERVGGSEGRLTHTTGDDSTSYDVDAHDHAAAMHAVIEAFASAGPPLAEADVVAVGHRVVQGGRTIDGPRLVDDELLAEIDRLSSLAPLHNPPNLAAIRVACRRLPDVPHVAVFDTAFFHCLPYAAATYALDRDVARENEIHRYGAHGTSHEYVSRQVARLLGRKDLKQIVLHIGNGVSASAVVAGSPVATSMGLTPLEGLVMGTRCGDIDPAIVVHLHRVAGLSVDEIDTLMNRRSGLLGLCGKSDMRDVLALIQDGDEDARLALDVYNHRLRSYVGAYAATMGGLDAITFTAGVGENTPEVRAGTLQSLEFLGVHLDEARNDAGEQVISTDDSAVTVLVVPTNEELEIARQAERFA